MAEQSVRSVSKERKIDSADRGPLLSDPLQSVVEEAPDSPDVIQGALRFPPLMNIDWVTRTKICVCKG